MKVYNETWLRNRAIQAKANYWQKKGLLTNEQLTAVKTHFPDEFYNPNIWIKIGLFIFTCLGCSFALGLTSVFFMAIFDDVLGSGLLSFVYAGLFYAFLTFIATGRKLYHSGVDNALLYGAVGWFTTGMFLVLSKITNDEVWLYGLLLLPVLIFAVIRHADWLITVGAYICFFFVISALCFKFPVGKLILPFVFMVFSGVIYFVKKRFFEPDKLFYWADCLSIIEILALITFYLGGNYGIVREGNAAITGTSGQIAFAPLFYAFTVLIPAAYLYFGIRQKNRILIVLGLLATVASVITFKLYFSIAPPEITLTIAGIVLIGIAWGCIRYLRPPKHGYTYEQDKEADNLNVEATIIAQTLGKTAQPQSGLQYGEGSFGGGGAGDKY